MPPTGKLPAEEISLLTKWIADGAFWPEHDAVLRDDAPSAPKITDADRQEWAEAFPGAVLDQELAKATAWLRANQTKARRSNWRRFLVGWLQRCQDKGGTDRQQTGRRPDDKPPPKRWLDEYQPAGYRRPHEAVELASTLKLKTEDT